MNRAQDIEVVPLADTFAAELRGIDLSRPVPEPTFATIRALFHEHAVIAFLDQRITPAQQVSFSRRFGELEIHGSRDFLLDGHPEIVVIGNLVVDGQPKALFARGDEQWHADSSFREVPSTGSLFYAVETPPAGGDTLFCDARAAYDTLPDHLRARADAHDGVHDLQHLHDVIASRNPGKRAAGKADRDRFPPVPQPLVSTNPETGRRSIFVCPDVITHVPGLPAAEGRALVQELVRHATQPRFVYAHKWRKGDLVMWDNRSVLHTASLFDSDRYLRIMHRTTVAGTAPLRAATRAAEHRA